MTHHPHLLLAGVTAAALLAGCTPGTPVGTTDPTAASPTTAATTPSPTATPTPTATLDADQTAALKSAEEYEAVMTKVWGNPPKHGQYWMIEHLEPVTHTDWIQASLNGVRPWRENGWREEGDVKTVTRGANTSATANGDYVQIRVTLCRDLRGARVINRKGKDVTDKAIGPEDFVERIYDMRKLKGDKAFKVWEIRGEEVSGCAA